MELLSKRSMDELGWEWIGPARKNINHLNQTHKPATFCWELNGTLRAADPATLSIVSVSSLTVVALLLNSSKTSSLRTWPLSRSVSHSQTRTRGTHGPCTFHGFDLSPWQIYHGKKLNGPGMMIELWNERNASLNRVNSSLIMSWGINKPSPPHVFMCSCDDCCTK